MNVWIDQDVDDEYLAQLEALESQARFVGTILIALLVFVVVALAGSITGVGT